MFSLINIIILILWIMSAFVDYNYFCYILQLKEYRMDRIKDFLSTKKGKDFWKKYIVLWRPIFVIIIFLSPIDDLMILKYTIITIFSLEFIINILQLKRGKLKHPVFTKKAILIIFSAILVEALLFFASGAWIGLLLLMSIRLLIISLVVSIFYIPTAYIKKIIIKKAKLKLSKYKNLKVIGITGSYGKSSVKNFLSTIIGKKYRVIKTPKNINTEIGIAKFILDNDFANADVFVVEMGAYKIGEIELICDMVEPTIGVLTAITEQHLALFGGIKMTQQAKYELLRSLPENGLAVVNSDNKYCREFLHELKCKKVTFGVEEEFNPDFLIKEFDNTAQGINFFGKMYNKDISVSAPVIGTHNAKNIVPCYLVADFLGISIEEAKSQTNKLVLPDNTLSIINYGEAIILDDTYNSNYNGFCAGLDVLSGYSNKKRIVVTRGIPELGAMSTEVHTKIGSEIAYIADELIILDKDNAEALIDGVGEKFHTSIKIVNDPNELLEIIKSYKNTPSVILLENRVPDILIKEVK
ncbi:MAG: hypothetical protein A3F93_00365 [Candidatus Magasanikbacteria bacterium RIFCSPLOWO2_12_FULL_34_7]|nr:MAG: hypothetical protein A3F93_00365 [Candidatus Magasanikbacteria bacterium RIFCSPLOWO2_12_FULL_34_7]